MFQIIVQIILFIYSIFVVYHIINLQKFNINGFIIDTGSIEEVQKNTLKLNPVIFYTQSLFNLNIKLSEFAGIFSMGLFS